MNDTQPPSPRQRLQTLLAIPEAKRTDAEWDEINELEIALASGMRQPQPTHNQRHGNPGQQNNRQHQHNNQNNNQQSRGSRSRQHRWSRGRNKPPR